MNKIKVIKQPTKNKPFLVIFKPSGLPSAPINENDCENALSYAIQLYPQIKNIKGKKAIEYGLLHRIDTATEGLLLIALSQDFYDYMQIEQSQNRFIKYYKAQCDIFENTDSSYPLNKNHLKLSEGITFEQKSFFRNYGIGNKEVRPVTQDSSKIVQKKVQNKKEYTTKITINKIYEKSAEVECEISQGYRHQVRCHLAWSGLPIKGDEQYNKKAENQLRFSATKLVFEYPRGDLNSYGIAPTWT